MKSILLASTVLIGSIGAARAADFAAAAPAGFVWTGGYVGLQAGYAWGKAVGGAYRIPTGEAAVLGNLDPDGFLGGVHAGYNYQFGNGFVLGGEADLTFADIKGSARLDYPNGPSDGNSATSRMNWNGSVRARAGYAIDRFLPYVTGGVAFGRYEYVPDYNATPPLPGSKTKAGWTLGAGVEYALTDRLTTRFEYRYTDYGDATYAIAGIPNHVSRVDLKTNDVRLGISYRF